MTLNHSVVYKTSNIDGFQSEKKRIRIECLRRTLMSEQHNLKEQLCFSFTTLKDKLIATIQTKSLKV